MEYTSQTPEEKEHSFEHDHVSDDENQATYDDVLWGKVSLTQTPEGKENSFEHDHFSDDENQATYDDELCGEMPLSQTPEGNQDDENHKTTTSETSREMKKRIKRHNKRPIWVMKLIRVKEEIQTKNIFSPEQVNYMNIEMSKEIRTLENLKTKKWNNSRKY